MRYSIVYSSRTGNTRLLADAIRAALPQEDCVYFGAPAPEALEVDCVFAGFWTDKSKCDPASAAFLQTLTDQKVFLFGTSGFSLSEEYEDKVLQRTKENLPQTVALLGCYLCRGKMPESVRVRCEQMRRSPIPIPRYDQLMESFETGRLHPDETDLEKLRHLVKSCMKA